VGVIFTAFSAQDLLTKIGVQDETVKTGAKKDIASPLRKMTPEERKLLETLLAEMQARFVGIVRERRPALTADAANLMMDGRVFSAAQALDGSLVDRIGYLEDSIAIAKRRAGVTDAKVVMYRRANEYADGIYSRAPLSVPQLNLFNFDTAALFASPRFLYLWRP
jgi:protease-4